VSVRTLNSWCRPYQRELQEMGVTPRMKVLPPHVVMFLAEGSALTWLVEVTQKSRKS